MNIFIINGKNIVDFQSLILEFNAKLFDNFNWNGSLDALNDLLRGGFGNKADTDYTIIWDSHEHSKENLGYDAMSNWLKSILKTAHSSNHNSIRNRIENARNSIGPTMFDVIIEIIREHGIGGREETDNIEIILC